MIEMAFTIPIVVYLIFAAFELIKINLTQIAIDKIIKECTLSLVAKKNVNDFDTIIGKYKPSFIPIGRCRYYCRVYKTLADMMKTSPYGGEKIGYPDYSGSDSSKPTTLAKSNVFGLYSHNIYIAKYGDYRCDNLGNTASSALLSSGVPSGYAFVLTIVVHYPFSSPLVEKLFNGGSNTTKSGYYILWARGSGIVN